MSNNIFNDNLIRVAVDKTSAQVASQKGCADSLTHEQEKENLVARYNQLIEDRKLKKHNGKGKAGIKSELKEMGAEITSLAEKIRIVKLKIKTINVNNSNRVDFHDCVFEVMKEQLSTFQYKQILRLAKQLLDDNQRN